MKSFNPISQINSLREQLTDAILDKDLSAQALFEGFIDEIVELYSLKYCDCCTEIFDDKAEDYCETCRVSAAHQRASDESDYHSRNF